MIENPPITGLDDALYLERLKDNIIIIHGEIDGRLAAQFFDQLHFVMKQPRTLPTVANAVTIEIMSPGGDAYPSLAIYDVIAHCGRPTVGLALGYVCSAAAMLVLQACTHRAALPKTRFLLHEVKELGGFEAKGTAENEDSLREQRAVQAVLCGILAERLGQTPEAVQRLIERREYYLGAEEAKELHLIDAIWTSWGPARNGG